MITLYRRGRGRVWWANIQVEGRRQRRSLRTKDSQVAAALKRHLEIEILSGGRLREITWSDFEAEFLKWIESQVRPSTLRGYRAAVERFGRFLQNPAVYQVRDITPAVVAEFTEERRRDIHPWRKRPMSAGGIRFDLRILHRVFSYAVECGYLQGNPVKVKNLNSVAGTTQPFNREEITAMLAEASKSPQLNALVLTFLHTGLRIGDVIALRKADVTGAELQIRTRKRGTVVAIRIHPALRAALDAHLAAQGTVQRKSEFLFSSSYGRPLVGMDKVLRRLWTRASIVGGHAHRFRDSFAVALLQGGASLYDVAKLLGNSVRVVEMHYAPYTRELQERGARLVNALDFTSKSHQ